MAGATDDPITTSALLPWSTPVVSEIHLAGIAFKLKSGFQSEAEAWGQRLVRVDRPLQPSEWLPRAVARLKAAPAPDCPKRITDAARRLAAEMAQAFQQRACDAAWTARSIENALRTWELW